MRLPENRAAGTRAEAETRARRALSSDAATRALAAARFTPVTGGLSNHAWRVDTGRETCFVRLGRAETLPGADLLNECRVLATTGTAGIAPEVVRCDPDQRLLVTRWVAAVHRRPPLRAPDIAAVARALATLHRLPVPAGVRTLDFARQARALGSLVEAAPGASSLRARAGEAFARLGASSPGAVLCHNDLNALNLLWQRTGRLWLVDWEYAGRGDAAFDLASFSSQHGLTARQRTQLLRAYDAAGGGGEPERLALALWTFDYVQWLWYRAALARPAAGIPARVARARAAALAAGLSRRASRVLRWNNAAFVD